MLEEKRNQNHEFDVLEGNDNNEFDDFLEDEEDANFFDLSDAKATKSKNNSKIIGKPGGLSIVNASCGHRVVLSGETYTRLGCPDEVQTLFKEKYLIIGLGLANQNERYTVRLTGKKKQKGSIYNRALVDEITEAYGLDFSCRTSITFGDVKYYEQEGATFVAVKIAE